MSESKLFLRSAVLYTRFLGVLQYSVHIYIWFDPSLTAAFDKKAKEPRIFIYSRIHLLKSFSRYFPMSTATSRAESLFGCRQHFVKENKMMSTRQHIFSFFFLEHIGLFVFTFHIEQQQNMCEC